MKIALVHDWLVSMRGGEKVFLEICRLFPSAEIYTLVHRSGSVDADIEAHRLHTSFLQKIPGSARHYPKLLPFFPMAIEAFDLTPYDVVISSSHCVAKGVITRPETLHVSYLHSPMRYIWDLHFTYFPRGEGNFLKRALYRSVANYLRLWDVASTNRVDKMIANSHFVAQRIWKYYRRKASVVHPPVEVDKFSVASEVDGYYLAFSSLVPYKRLDLAIQAFNQLRLPLKIIGGGSERAALEKIAGTNIEFLDWLPDNEMRRVLAQARALVFPGVEDFGIIPVEANACGVPVIAFGAGGVLDTIIPLDERHQPNRQPTGLFFAEQSVGAIVHAVECFEAKQIFFQDRQAIRQTTFRFHPEVFRRKITTQITRAARRRGLVFHPEINAPVCELDETKFVREPAACLV
ncbi:MAG: glycosyltransferase [candidate division KSB1 bacterium]|nr:glycosyltransferase [candidate division KSB1 bacterium]MDZ7367399.1 glycosyltransferase [candidate division KSB1 bacterium]MDZ7405280.1 glycosyltransferase [candidate division KSB1 bacterium]